MSGATTGLQMREQTLTNGPILESTWEGEPRPTLTQRFASCTGTRPRAMPNTFEGSAGASKSLIHTPILQRNGFILTQSGSIPMRISLATRGTTTDFLALLSVRMQSIIMGLFLDGKAQHLKEQTVVERRAKRPQRRIMGRPIMAAQRPENASYQSNEPVQFLRQTTRQPLGLRRSTGFLHG